MHVALAAPLGFVHGVVGAGQQLVHLRGQRRVGGHPDAHTQCHLHTIGVGQRKGRVKNLQQAVEELLELLRAGLHLPAPLP